MMMKRSQKAGKEGWVKKYSEGWKIFPMEGDEERQHSD